MNFRTVLSILVFVSSVVACTRHRAELGSAQNPIKFFLVPSVETGVLEESAKAIKIYLEANTPYKFTMSVPTSYIAVVEAFGSKRADVASLNTYGYATAHKKYKAQARLTVIRNGEDFYRSAILIRADSGIKTLKELNGKRVAYVDSASTSGYFLPRKLFADEGIRPKEIIFAQRHDNVISMVYQRQVDAGAVYYSPPLNKEIQDARRLVKTQYPDIEKKVVVLQLTESIPNDTITFRHDLPEEIKTTVEKALVAFVNTEAGKIALEKTFAITGFKPVTDADYAKARQMFEEESASSEARPNL